MKEKFYVRKAIGVDEVGDHRLVFGILYDEKKKVLTVGGPSKYKILTDDIVKRYFHVGLEDRRDLLRRFQKICREVSLKVWKKGLEKLKEKFVVTPTRRFRRLMR